MKRPLVIDRYAVESLAMAKAQNDDSLIRIIFYGIICVCGHRSGIDDAGMLSFKLDTGAYGTLDTSWSRPRSYPTWGDVKIEVLGERGIARVDAFSQNLAIYSDQTGKAEWVHWGSDADLGLVHDFVNMIATGREPFITGYDGLKALEVALAAYDSAERGEPVVLPLAEEGGTV